MSRTKRIMLMIICGIAVGFVNGFLGAGGGIILVPVLHYVASFSTKKSHGTAIAIILPICMASSIVYLCKGSIDWKLTIPVLIGVFGGGIIGSFLLKKLKSDIIAFIFSIVLILAGIKMMFF